MTSSKCIRPLACLAVLCLLAGALRCAAASPSAAIGLAPIAPVAAGDSLTLAYTVQNTGPTSQAFGIGAELRRGALVVADLGARSTAAVPAGGTTTGSIRYTVPSTWGSGTYVARCAAWIGAPGSGTFVSSVDRSFDVRPPRLLPAGRIAFHRDSDNQSLHPPNGNPDDGHIFILNLQENSISNVTAGLGIWNCLNPQFSPDGAAMAFMGIPAGQPRLWNNMRIYLLDLAEGGPALDLGSGQDPGFSPDGRSIVFKRADGQIHLVGRDGSSPQTLTSGGAERSGPNYGLNPADQRVVYWNTRTVGSTRFGDIAWRLPDGTEQTLVSGTASRYCYYPRWRDADHILFTASEGGDNLYEYTLSTASYGPLAGLNTSAEESDPFPVGGLIGFASTRAGGSGGGYDLYLARADGSAVEEIVSASSPLHELGGSYSPFTESRKLSLLGPTNGSVFPSGSTTMLAARGYSSRMSWSGAFPKIVIQGPVSAEFTDLKDDGTGGDSTAADGIYSRLAALPTQPGLYTGYASALAADNGLVHEIRSASVSFRLVDPVRPILTHPAITGAGFRVSLATQAGFNYILESKNSLGDPAWTPQPAVRGTGTVITLTRAGTGLPAGFIRVRVDP